MIVPDSVQKVATVSGNPFVQISAAWRYGILLYLVLVEFLPSVVSPLVHGTADPLAVPAIAVKLVNTALLALPFLCARFGGVQMGWFHPIAMGIVSVTAVEIIRFPQSLLAPLMVWFGSFENWSFHPQILGYSEEAMYGIVLKGEFLKLIALGATYMGFAYFNWIPSHAQIRVVLKRDTRPILGLSAVAGLAVAAYVFASSGGIAAHMAQFALGRFTAVGDIGHLAALVSFAPVALVVAYLFEPTLLRRVIFWLLFLTTCICQFGVTGSRSGVLLPVMFLATVWVYRNQRIPTWRLAAVAALSWLTLGVLGELRSTVWSGEPGVEFASLVDFDLTAAVASTNAQMTERVSGDVYLPTIALVPEKVPYLNGASYIAALAAFVPRALWESKPRGVDAYAGAMIFEGRERADGFVGMGTPPGSVAESYWNFGMPGVFVVFFLFGALRKLLANAYLAYQDSIPVAALFLLSIFFLPAPGGPDMIRFVRLFAFLALIFVACGLRFERKLQR